jgi:hypothetical protein
MPPCTGYAARVVTMWVCAPGKIRKIQQTTGPRGCCGEWFFALCAYVTPFSAGAECGGDEKYLLNSVETEIQKSGALSDFLAGADCVPHPSPANRVASPQADSPPQVGRPNNSLAFGEHHGTRSSSQPRTLRYNVHSTALREAPTVHRRILLLFAGLPGGNEVAASAGLKHIISSHKHNTKSSPP